MDNTDDSMRQTKADLLGWLTYISFMGVLPYLRIVGPLREFIEQFVEGFKSILAYVVFLFLITFAMTSA